MTVLVTGGAGFIGSALVRHLIRDRNARVVNVDKLTYAGDLSTVAEVAGSALHVFEQVDVADSQAMGRLFAEHRPDAVYHLAAESHVDRSIDDPDAFIVTNVLGTHRLLEVARAYWSTLDAARRGRFRFLHVSTDEVFGSAGTDERFHELTRYDPSSPYSASKAAADHFVRAWHRTFGLPTLVCNCSNNYGPYQFPEKLIPLIVLKAMRGEPLPVYGDGRQVRDWLYVDDHVRALTTVMDRGTPGESYNVGGGSERTNLEVVRGICRILGHVAPRADYESLVQFVTDRPGHDRRYAMDASKIGAELGWRPAETFETGLEKTVRWILSHGSWYDAIRATRYAGDRLGVISRARA